MEFQVMKSNLGIYWRVYRGLLKVRDAILVLNNVTVFRIYLILEFHKTS